MIRTFALSLCALFILSAAPALAGGSFPVVRVAPVIRSAPAVRTPPAASIPRDLARAATRQGRMPAAARPHDGIPLAHFLPVYLAATTLQDPGARGPDGPDPSGIGLHSRDPHALETYGVRGTLEDGKIGGLIIFVLVILIAYSWLRITWCIVFR